MSRCRLRAVASCLLAIPLLVPATASAVPPVCEPATGLEANVQAGDSIDLPAAPCTDDDGDAIDIEVTMGPAHGTLDPSGTQPIGTQRTYTADVDAGGEVDVIKFRAVAGGENSNEATLEINIGANHPPVCLTPLRTSVESGQELLLSGAPGVPCDDADGDLLTYAIVDPPDHGTITAASPTGFLFTYRPAAGYVGPDVLTFRAMDASAQSNLATLSIAVTAPATGGGGAATPPAVTPPPSDVTPPTLSLAVSRSRLALARVLRRGVSVTLTAGEPGRATVRLLLSRRDARRLGVDRKATRVVTVGRLSRTLAAGDNKVAVKLTRKARRRLAQVRKVKLKLEVTIADAAGNVRRVTRTVTLRRAT